MREKFDAEDAEYMWILMRARIKHAIWNEIGKAMKDHRRYMHESPLAEEEERELVNALIEFVEKVIVTHRSMADK